MNYNPFEILDLQDGATKEQIKAAYKTLVKKHHPDAGGQREDFERIQRAYDLLQDEEKLAQWHATGQEPQGNLRNELRREALMKLLMLHLDAALEEDEFTSIKDEMQRTLQQHEEQLGKQKAELQQAIAKLEKRLSRLQGQSVIRDIVATRVRKKQEELAHRELEGELLLEAQAIVTQCQEEEAPERPQEAPMTSQDLEAQMEALFAMLNGRAKG